MTRISPGPIDRTCLLYFTRGSFFFIALCIKPYHLFSLFHQGISIVLPSSFKSIFFSISLPFIPFPCYCLVLVLVFEDWIVVYSCGSRDCEVVFVEAFPMVLLESIPCGAIGEHRQVPLCDFQVIVVCEDLVVRTLQGWCLDSTHYLVYTKCLTVLHQRNQMASKASQPRKRPMYRCSSSSSSCFSNQKFQSIAKERLFENIFFQKTSDC